MLLYKTKNICSFITVYMPQVAKLKKNIEIILQYSDVVYLLFNSPVLLELQFSSKIIIIDNGKNIGISRAINKGVNIAIKSGYEYAVLFDQDSILTRENFEIMFFEICKNEKIACMGPSLNVRNNVIPINSWVKNDNFVFSNNVISVNNIITSGMLVNIRVFEAVNGFNEDFPVDFSDFVFCWRALYNGYFVVQNRNAYLIHEVGNRGMNVFGRTVHFHAPYRNYFLVRDTLNICFKTKETPLLIGLRFFFFLPFRMLFYLFMLDNRFLRLKMYWLGFKDFFVNKKHFGSISNILNAE